MLAEPPSGSHPAARKDYVLGTSDDEVVRLGYQHRAWAEFAFALWERAGFRSGQTLLDVGCGPGFATVDLAHLVGPSGRVVAVDASRKFIDLLRARLGGHEVAVVDPRVADIQRLDLAPGSIDGAYTRWVLCFVPEPEAVVAAVARALVPGGVFAIQDYFNYRALALAPRSRALEKVVDAVDASWRRGGGDLDVCGRLPAICERHGLAVREIKPLLRVARSGGALWNWPQSFFRGFVPQLVREGLLDAASADEFFADWAARSRDPSAYFCTPPVIDIIAEKR